MQEKKKEDLRVRKTKKAIRTVFEDMICEMDYEEISIKELTARAEINRKTFYLHYQDLDELLAEYQDEIVDTFIKQKVSYKNMDDIKSLIRLYFTSFASQSYVHERMLCAGSYQRFSDEVNRRIMEFRRQTNRGAFGLDKYAESLVFAYFGTCSAILYRQWVADGKKLSVDDLIDIAIKLICNGMSSVVRN